ncbi:MAG: leucyl/phenylalanyl-tRNA--protein transferase [Deltaproteobacteria bacterium]|nr:leucyl/phenylalanyl-tRNA--protein transferase [Deltaproteobacteria bacterium]
MRGPTTAPTSTSLDSSTVTTRVFRLHDALVFPDPALADDDGLLAVGGDLRPERLLLAYGNGIFPWYSEGRPILWWSPAPRFVLLPGELHVGRSLRKAAARRPYRITLDTAFDDVMAHCARAPRPGQFGTWITADMRRAYGELHRLGYAHSVEAWSGDQLVGGLYGVALGRAYFGESMFAHAPDASKLGFVALVEQLQRWQFELVDCQVHTEHLERFGARMFERVDFQTRLAAALAHPHRPGPWRFDGPEA